MDNHHCRKTRRHNPPLSACASQFRLSSVPFFYSGKGGPGKQSMSGLSHCVNRRKFKSVQRTFQSSHTGEEIKRHTHGTQRAARRMQCTEQVMRAASTMTRQLCACAMRAISGRWWFQMVLDVSPCTIVRTSGLWSNPLIVLPSGPCRTVDHGMRVTARQKVASAALFSRLRSCCWLGGQRIIRPGMPGIPSRHLLLHRRIAAGPETDQILCHLYGTTRR